MIVKRGAGLRGFVTVEPVIQAATKPKANSPCSWIWEVYQIMECDYWVTNRNSLEPDHLAYATISSLDLTRFLCNTHHCAILYLWATSS